MDWKNELEGLEQIVCDDLLPQLKSNKDITSAELKRLDGCIFSELSSCKKQISKYAFGFKKPKHRAVYIQRHQRAAIRLDNMLVHALNASSENCINIHKEDDGVTRLLKSTSVHSRTILHFLEEEFPESFNMQELVPKSLLFQYQSLFRSKAEALQMHLQRLKADKKLVEVVLYPYKLVMDGRLKPCNYQKLYYLKELLEQIESLCTGKRKSFYNPLLQLLICQDFNTIRFKNWLIDAIYEDVNRSATVPEKVEKLLYHHSRIDRMITKPGVQFMVCSHSVKEDVVNNLGKEIKLQETKQKLAIITPEHFKEEKTEKEESGIYFGLSVEELGLLLAAQKQTGMIKNEHLTQLSAFYARHGHTVRRDKISSAHLYNCFSKREVAVIESLDSKLVDVINLLRKWKRKI